MGALFGRIIDSLDINSVELFSVKLYIGFIDFVLTV